MSVCKTECLKALSLLKLSGLPVCIHCSLGLLEGGAPAILQSLAAQGCSAVVPAFSYKFLVPPPPDQRPARNGWDYSVFATSSGNNGMVYSPESNDIDPEMGALAAETVAQTGRYRGNHALNSFAAVGPQARSLISKQGPLDVYGPLKELAALDGFILLIGVGLERVTFVHVAEEMAGRQLFRRWANGPDGQPAMYETGGCSEGFSNLEPALSALAKETYVGKSRWSAFSARSALAALAAEIRSRPEVTRCADPLCDRCEDAINGGPIL